MRKDKSAARIQIDRDLYDNIKSIIANKNISVTATIELILNNFLNTNNKKNLIPNYTERDNKKPKEIRLYFADNEHKALQENKKFHGFKSIRAECEYRILNSLYENKQYFTNIDIEAFTQLKTELNSIGRNINMIAKKIQEKNATINYKKLEEFLESISANIHNSTTILNKKIDQSIT